MEKSFAHSSSEVLKFFKVDPNKGLAPKQVCEARKKYGLNGKFFLLQALKQIYVSRIT